MPVPFAAWLKLRLLHPVLAKPFHRDGWVYEKKYDGWRVVAYKDGRTVGLVSRRGVDRTNRFPDIAAAVAPSPRQGADPRRRGRGVRR